MTPAMGHGKLLLPLLYLSHRPLSRLGHRAAYCIANVNIFSTEAQAEQQHHTYHHQPRPSIPLS